jgi:hypothetical protein
MKDKNTPAFPFVAKDHTGTMINMGMSLRDYFAAQALASSTGWYLSEINNWDNKERADWAYKQADQMLKQRGSDE